MQEKESVTLCMLLGADRKKPRDAKAKPREAKQ